MAKPLALTSGEPAGIGPDIAIAAWLRRDELKLPPFYLLGDRGFLADRAKTARAEGRARRCPPRGGASPHLRSALPVVATGKAATARPGRPDATSADAALASIRQAVSDVAAGKASAVVTNPIAKSVLYRAGFRHPGHTEFLAELAANGGTPPQPVMMLWSPALAVVPVTIHRRAARGARAAVERPDRRDRPHRGHGPEGPLRPRRARGLSISGLNPHAGEDGSLGTEEIEIVAPAVEIAARRRHRGPGSAAGGHHVSRGRAQDL